MKRLLLIGPAVMTLALAFGVMTAAAASFTVSPWAFACGQTTHGNPATATDPGGTGCPTDKADHSSYCAPDAETPGTASSSYAAGKLTLTKLGKTCDFLSSGATIGGLSTLTSASADCLTPSTCNPGGNLRLNIVDAEGGFHFVGAASDMDSSGHINFKLKDANTGASLEGVKLKSIDLIADNQGTVVLDNLSFTGTAAVTATAAATPTPAAAATPTTAHLATTGGGGSPLIPLGVGSTLILFGVIALLVRRRTTA